MVILSVSFRLNSSLILLLLWKVPNPLPHSHHPVWAQLARASDGRNRDGSRVWDHRHDRKKGMISEFCCGHQGTKESWNFFGSTWGVTEFHSFPVRVLDWMKGRKVMDTGTAGGINLWTGLEMDMDSRNCSLFLCTIMGLGSWTVRKYQGYVRGVMNIKVHLCKNHCAKSKFSSHAVDKHGEIQWTY